MKIFIILIKDIKTILYDKKAVAAIVLMPIIIMTILGASLQGVMEEDEGIAINTIKIGIVKEYNSYEEEKEINDLLNKGLVSINKYIDIDLINPEKMFFEDFLGSKELDFLEYEIMSGKESVKELEKNNIVSIIILPKGFLYSSYMNMIMPTINPVEIQIIKNPSNLFMSDIVERIFQSYAKTTNDITTKKAVAMDAIFKYGLENAFINNDEKINIEEILSNYENQRVAIKNIYKNKPVSSFQYYSAAIMGMFLLYSASLGAKGLLDEKKEHTLQRLTVIGIKENQILISNFFRIFTISVFQGVIMIIYSNTVLKVYWGNIINAFSILIMLSIAIGGLGIIVSLLAIKNNSYTVINVFEFVVIHFMALVGGSFLPIEILPKPLNSLSFLSINGIGLKLFTNNMNGLSLLESKSNIIFLATYSIIFIIVALYISKVTKKEQRL